MYKCNEIDFATDNFIFKLTPSTKNCNTQKKNRKKTIKDQRNTPSFLKSINYKQNLFRNTLKKPHNEDLKIWCKTYKNKLREIASKSKYIYYRLMHCGNWQKM